MLSHEHTGSTATYHEIRKGPHFSAIDNGHAVPTEYSQQCEPPNVQMPKCPKQATNSTVESMYTRTPQTHAQDSTTWTVDTPTPWKEKGQKKVKKKASFTSFQWWLALETQLELKGTGSESEKKYILHMYILCTYTTKVLESNPNGQDGIYDWFPTIIHLHHVHPRSILPNPSYRILPSTLLVSLYLLISNITSMTWAESPHSAYTLLRRAWRDHRPLPLHPPSMDGMIP